MALVSASLLEQFKEGIIREATSLFGPNLVGWITLLLNEVKADSGSPHLVIAGGDPAVGDAPEEAKAAILSLVSSVVAKIPRPIVRLVLTAFVAKALPQIIDRVYDGIFGPAPSGPNQRDPLVGANLTEFGDLKECDHLLPPAAK